MHGLPTARYADSDDRLTLPPVVQRLMTEMPVTAELLYPISWVAASNIPTPNQWCICGNWWIVSARADLPGVPTCRMSSAIAPARPSLMPGSMPISSTLRTGERSSGRTPWHCFGAPDKLGQPIGFA